MTLHHKIHIKSDNLLQKLGSLQFLADINSDALLKDPFLSEFLAFKMEIVKGYIAELQVYEEFGDESKCKPSFDNAIIFLEQIQVLIDRMLDDQCEQAWLDFQREPRFI